MGMQGKFWSNGESCLILKKSNKCLQLNFSDDTSNTKGFHVKVMDILKSYPISEVDIKHVSIVWTSSLRSLAKVKDQNIGKCPVSTEISRSS